MDFKFVLYEIKDKVAVITINSPKTLNAINDDIIEELYQAITAAEQDEKVKVMLLQGTGKAFCAGGDLGFMYKAINDGTIDLATMMKNSARLPLAVKKSSKPVICAVRGAAAGAGCSIALCCDYCFASDNAIFVEAFVKVGLLPDTGGMFALSKAVGPARAIQLAMTGEPVNAEKALAYGMVYKVLPDAELDEKVMKFAVKLAQGPSSCYKYLKEIQYNSEWGGFDAYLADEQRLQALCGQSPNFREGVFSFVEKRLAHFE